MVARVAGELTEIGNADLGLRAQLQITAGFDQRSIARDRAPMPSKLKVAGSNPARVANKIYMLERIPQRFSWQAPSWSPALPLSVDACLALEHDPCPRLNLVGLFGHSMRNLGWDKMHPSFRTYACGLMVFPATPDEIRTDEELLREFPPMRLDGLADDDTNWRTPEMIAEDRSTRAWIHEMGARCEQGTAKMQAID